MTSKNYGETGVAPDVQLGKNGPRWNTITSPTKIRARNTVDTAFVNVQGLDAATDDDFTTLRQRILRQTNFAEIVANTTKSNATFSTLLTSSLTTTAQGRIRVWFSASFFQSGLLGGTVEFRLLLDGVAARVTASNVGVLTEPQSVSLTYRTATLTPASHTITIQWRIAGVLATANINPTATNPTTHASLNIDEVGG